LLILGASILLNAPNYPLITVFFNNAQTHVLTLLELMMTQYMVI